MILIKDDDVNKGRLLGAHVGLTSNYAGALTEAEELGINTIQLFTHNPRGWGFRPINEDALSRFRELRVEKGIGPVVSHSNYLINIGTKGVVREKSIACLRKEIEYAHRFGCEYFVFHVGKHKEESLEEGIKNVISGLNEIKDVIREHDVMVLLETVAGQGTEIGVSFEELNRIIVGVDDSIKEKIGVCLDTCHVFAAGYDLSTREGIDKTFEEIRSTITFDKIRVIHLNDSKHPLGSRKDRHENIGKGYIGIKGFEEFLNRDEIKKMPLILETPGDENGSYETDLRTVRSLLR